MALDIRELRERVEANDPNGKLAAQQETKSLMRHIDPNFIRTQPASPEYREGWERIFGKRDYIDRVAESYPGVDVKDFCDECGREDGECVCE